MGLEKQDRIDRYIREEMTSAEREAFERDLKADQALSGLYEESRLIAHAIRDVAADRELMAIMRNASADEIRSVIGKERRSRQRWLWWAIGSVAALLLVAVVMRITLYTSSSSSQMDTLYQTYYEPFRMRPGLSRGASGEADALKEKAYGLYMAGDYASAAEFRTREAGTSDRASGNLGGDGRSDSLLSNGNLVLGDGLLEGASESGSDLFAAENRSGGWFLCGQSGGTLEEDALKKGNIIFQPYRVWFP